MAKLVYDHVFVIEILGEHTAHPIRYSRCKICGGVPEKNMGNDMRMEKSLATHCPGQQMTREQILGIGDTLDFKDGEWITLKPATR
ncbi:hypothetical protein [Bradyrhizobium sp. MOS002]|uniref:hypothetical protein n=1 Tax=Bradyrhizobium sp. MOS002 TaxID=2133947 RepID=UPI000D126B47|nr:hypothetical protein [Bradyrhizobium sp. MOS002]PSO28805.1 hypothetical protein C7G41_24210 [Bradyrhizobium sp. MOS002]